MIAMRQLAGAIALVAIAVGASAQAWIPIEVTNGHITFPAIIEGVATRAALDTGANVNSIDAGFAERAGFTLSGLRFKIRSAHLPGKIVASEAELDVELFGVKATLRDTPALHHPSAPLNLGANFLEPFVLQIDYPNSRMRILARAAFDLAKYDNVPMRKAEGSCEPYWQFTHDKAPCLPVVQATFPGDRKLWLMLDTGASGPLALSRAVAEREGWLAAYRKAETTSSDVHGKVSAMEMLVFPSLRLGPFELGSVPVVVPAQGERLTTGRESWGRVQTGTHITRGARANGVLGYDVLRHFVVTIDLVRELMHIAPPAETAAAPAP